MNSHPERSEGLRPHRRTLTGNCDRSVYCHPERCEGSRPRRRTLTGKCHVHIQGIVLRERKLTTRQP